MPSHSRIRLPAASAAGRTGDHAQTTFSTWLVDSSNDAIVAKSLDGSITSWNRAAEAIYGYSAEEILGKSVQVLIHAAWPDEMAVTLRRIRNGERVEHYESTRIRKDGKTITVSLTVSPILDCAGALVGVSSIGRDVTKRKLGEDLAREASAYARNLIEASLDPLFTISVDGKITDANEATLKVTGVRRETLIGTGFSDYFTEPSKAREGYLEAFSQGFVTDYSLTIRHKTGGLTDVLFNASVYKDTRGNVLGVLAAARDVTAKNKAEAQVAQQRTQELDKLAELERFKKLTVGRELKMIELKTQIKELKRELDEIQSRVAAAAAP